MPVPYLNIYVLMHLYKVRLLLPVFHKKVNGIIVSLRKLFKILWLNSVELEFNPRETDSKSNSKLFVVL